MKIVSNIYKTTSIRFGEFLVEFTDGKAEVTEEAWEYIKSCGFQGISSEEEANKLAVVKTKEEADTYEAMLVLKEEYDHEIERLNGVIKYKDQQIERLNQSLSVWKDEVERLSKGGEPKEIVEETAKEEIAQEGEMDEDPMSEEEIAALKEDMQKMDLNELKELAVENGMSKQKAGRFKFEDQKEELINAIISLPKK